jgi:hypothetical protein
MLLQARRTAGRHLINMNCATATHLHRQLPCRHQHHRVCAVRAADARLRACQAVQH